MTHLQTEETKFDLLELDKLTNQEQKKAKGKDKDKAGKKLWEFLQEKKHEMKETTFRQRFDGLFYDAKVNLVDTVDYNPANRSFTNSGVVSNFRPIYLNMGGNTNYTMTMGNQPLDGQTTSIPFVKEPIIFTKINAGIALMFSKPPEATFKSEDKVLSTVSYHLWRKTWENHGGNGLNALQNFGQNVLTFGWGAFRTYKREITQPVRFDEKTTVDRILFDDVYRESLPLDRVWFGVGSRPADPWSYTEWLFEKDIPFDEFIYQMSKAGVSADEIDKKKVNFKTLPKDTGPKSDVDKISDEIAKSATSSLSAEGEREETTKSKTHVTISYYENRLTNKLIAQCGCYNLFNGELSSADGYASISHANLWIRDHEDPHGVGLYELARGNESLANHLNILTPQQVEAELSPLVFAKGAANQTPNGNNTFSRKPGVINNVNAAAGLEVFRTTGNPSAAMGLIKNREDAISRITGINELIMGDGVDSTLGATVIQKEATLNKLEPARNNIAIALTNDAYIALSLISKYYSVDRVANYISPEHLAMLQKVNPDYFFSESDMEGETLMSQKVSAPFSIKIEYDEEKQPIDSSFEEVHEEEIYTRRELMQRLNIHKEVKTLSDKLTILIDMNSMLQVSSEVQQQKLMSLLPVIGNMTNQAMMAARQDPELGIVMFKQIMHALEVMKEDPYNWMPKDIVDKAMTGELVDQEMVELAKMNQAAALQQQMAQQGIPEAPQPMTNMPQTEDAMRDAVNGSVGKLG